MQGNKQRKSEEVINPPPPKKKEGRTVVNFQYYSQYRVNYTVKALISVTVRKLLIPRIRRACLWVC